MDDREIVELYWQRDQQAVAETAARYGAYCRICRSSCPIRDFPLALLPALWYTLPKGRCGP